VVPGLFRFAKGKVIRIPARPFLRPVFEEHGKPDEVAKRFLARVATLLGGDFGA
jgi:hypothetical protein